MSEIQSEGYVTVIGLGLVQPILSLVQQLQSGDPRVPNEVQTGMRENGYSVSIILLSAALMESAVNRTAYVRNERMKAWPDYFRTISTNYSLAEDLEEVYAMRNLITHSHLWGAEITWDHTGDMKFAQPPKLRAGYGDDRHRRVINEATRKSRVLKLNMFPSRIWRRDAYLALKTVQRGIAELEKLDIKYFPLSHFHFRFDKSTLTLPQIVERLTIPKEA